jgi:hypothetical protein
MDVTQNPITCALPVNGQSGCGCRARSSGAAKAAVIAAGTAAACTACCVSPFVLPAVIMANIGSMLVLLDRAHGWVIWLAVFAVAGAWLWIGYQARARRAGPARSTLAMMAVATLVLTVAASWPLIKPLAFHAFGITKKQVDKN